MGSSRRIRCLATLLLWPLGIVPPAAAAVAQRWYTFEPLGVAKTGAAGAKFSTLIEGTPTSVRLDCSDGSTVPLSAAGGGIWTADVSHAQLLFGYGSDSVNRNFVGFLRIFEGTTQSAALNVFVDVYDENVPPVVITSPSPNLRRTRYVANLWIPTLPLAYDSALQAITQQFYQSFPDDFDFVNIVFALPSFRGGAGLGNRYHFQVKNTVSGIGSSLINNTAQYGSAGRLQGISVFPTAGFFDMGETGSIHEIGHQWINFSAHPLLKLGSPHWPISTPARGVMGLSIAGSNVGGNFPWDIVPAQSGYQFVSAGVTREFNDFDLYLMGLLPAGSVSPQLVAQNQNQTPCQNCPVGAVSTVTVNDLIAFQGARVPDASSSQKQFRYATIVVTRDRPLSDAELAFCHRFAARGEATQPLPFSSGLEKGTAKPFFVATRGLGALAGALDSSGCADNPTTLCLNGGRFQVRVSWRVPSQGTSGAATAVPLTSDTGYFWFFTSNNIELVVKAVDGRSFNNKFWVFYGALSDVEYTVTVTDTATGVVRTYFNPSGQLASAADTAAFNGSPSLREEPQGPQGTTGREGQAPPLRLRREEEAACVGDGITLCLNGSRFQVRVDWRVPAQGTNGRGQAFPLTADTGYFWFFSSNNVELVVKVVDGRPVNNRFWVFYGALSNVEYTITITDTATGAVKTYFNPSGTLASVADTSAF